MNDQAAHALATSVLVPGERLLWAEAAPSFQILITAVIGALLCAAVFALMCKIGQNGAAPGVPHWVASGAVLLLQVCLCFGFVRALILGATAWSTAYAITNERVVIVAREPWLDVLEYREPSIAYYKIEGRNLSLYDGIGSRRVRIDLNDLENPAQAMALIRTNIAPRVHPY